jgi:arginyl-tRNA synthetase
MKQEIQKIVEKVGEKLGISSPVFKIDYPDNSEHGDFSCNVAMVYAKQMKLAPKVLAEQIVASLNGELGGVLKFVESIGVAGPGFINFKVKDVAFAKEVVGDSVAPQGLALRQGKKIRHILIEHTDPNAFKAFHIGHLMANAIGESLSRLVGADGSKVTKICYPSDIGLHIAKSVWAMKKHESEIPTQEKSIIEKTSFLGKMYVEGTKLYDEDEKIKSEIDGLNKELYEKTNPEVNHLYEMGKKWSMDHYELLYKRLGTSFDDYIYESESAPLGKEIVLEYLKKGIFEVSEGATVFKGEKFGLHTRVFLNSAGLTTYEAKDLGLNTKKFKKYPDADESIIVTATEQNDYFKVIKKVLTLIDENIGSKTKHIGHGMLRFASGKMSSRTGNVITAESLIEEIKSLVIEKIADREFSPEEKDEVADIIAIGAIKYTILRQAIGGDVIFDSASSISFEGDSGPYLQYAVVRANAVLGKVVSSQLKVVSGNAQVLPEKVTMLEKLLSRYTDIKERARAEYAPQTIAQYLMSLAGAFNGYYAVNQIVDDNDPLSPYRVALTKKFVETMTDGLWLLGIKIPKRM